jgi:hypothetical protein
MPAGESARLMANELRAKAKQLSRDAENWDAGAIGEERVGAVLDAGVRPTTRVMHDRLLKPSGSKANLDHIVVSPAGVFLIDTKNWVGDVTEFNGSLWQHWTTSDGPQSAGKRDEVDKVARMAAAMQKEIGRPVTPVLCLAGDRAECFHHDDPIRGVHVVPVQRLLSWLDQRPAARPVPDVPTLAVDLSMRFPPAVGGGLTLAALPAAPPPGPIVPETHRRRQAPRPRRRQPRRAPTTRASASKLIATLAALVGLVVLAPKLATALGNGAAAVINHAMTTSPGRTPPAPQPSTTLTPTQLRALDDWRIRAGLYAANDKPAALAYVPDSGLGNWSADCRRQEQKLAAYRPGLLHAPERELAASAKRFDIATRQYLAACRADRPVALHHAEGAMGAAASEVNLRYARLTGQDPTSPLTKRVL